MDKNTIIEKILKLLISTKNKQSLNQISKSLGIKSESSDFIKLKNSLNELVQQNLIIRHSRRLYELIDYDKTSEYRGIVQFNKGVSFVNIKGSNFDKVIIQRKDLNTAFEGDKVKIRLNAAMEGKKPKGEVVEILKRANHKIVGSIEFDGNFWFLIPDEDRYYIDFLIPPEKLMGAKEGSKVAATLFNWQDHHKSPQAEVIEIIGRSGYPVSEFDSIPSEFFLNSEFPENVVREANKVAKPIDKQTILKRLDLRHEEIITIDPVDAKDFDDALSLTILDNGNYYLGVHIADVSHYVIENGYLDKEALARGNSVYLVDRVIPMLPENLSNDICSLKPNRVRCAYSVFMEFDKSGVLKNYNIKESVIKSKKRFNYDEVLQIIKSYKGPRKELIFRLHELAQILKERRFDKGGIRFETIEVKFELDQDKNPTRSHVKQSTESTSLVEECMLAANKTVAMHVRQLSKKYGIDDNLPFLYRVHDEPDIAKLEDVLNFIRSFDRSIKLKSKSSKDIDRLIQRFQGKPEWGIINQVLLRAMAKAEYSSDNIGHYGLGFKEYSHFTSPIRRYPDLIIHRLLKLYSNGKPSGRMISQYRDELERIASHCCDREKIATEAERASIKVAQTFLAKQFVGKEFDGTVSGITNFGVFILIDTLNAEGMIHIRDLGDDYYTLDEKNYRLIGKRKRKEFFYGKRLRIKISSVNLDKRKINLSIVNDKI